MTTPPPICVKIGINERITQVYVIRLARNWFMTISLIFYLTFCKTYRIKKIVLEPKKIKTISEIDEKEVF